MIDEYNEIWMLDFEFQAVDGNRPVPICMVAREMRSRRVLRLWRDELLTLSRPPFDTGAHALYVAYYNSAEFGCFLALGWPMPCSSLDLCVEFKLLTSGVHVPCGRGLLGALHFYGIPAIDAEDKDSMRELAMRGEPFTEAEKKLLLDYCQSDVDALIDLFPRMLPKIDLSLAKLRARYMAAAAHIEWTGVPIDVPTLRSIRDRWHEIQDRLIEIVDKDFGVYDGRRFRVDRWSDYLVRQQIPWPQLASGNLELTEEVFREMSDQYPCIAPLRELRQALSQLRLNELAVGRDGRNRCLLSTFQSKTGRNQPSSSQYIFGPAVWLRNLIKPSKGMALAYIDYEQQEFGIGAALSGDIAMQNAYTTGDPYLAFAIQAGAVPGNATKETHSKQRNQYKQCCLGVQYLMGEEALARKLNESTAHSRQLLRRHREVYPDYWKWSEQVEVTAMLCGRLRAAYGWAVNVGPDANPRSLRNFPLQANGAEMLRIACILAVEDGIVICAPVHDALLIEANEDDIAEAVVHCQKKMADASAAVLSGFRLRTEAKIVKFPDRYSDPRGEPMWNTVARLIHDKPDTVRHDE